jgi:hypothetical protein
VTLQRIDELTEPPVVGKYYLVQCVRGKWRGMMGDWPVMGSKHDDARFLNFPQRHYHLNRFFLDDESATAAAATPLGEFQRETPNGAWMRGYPENNPLPPPNLRRLRCRRSEVVPFPTDRTVEKPAWTSMYSHYAGHQCKRGHGWICPHKGLDLGPIAPGPDGLIMCPLHGLRVDAGTGVVEPPRLELSP